MVMLASFTTGAGVDEMVATLDRDGAIIARGMREGAPNTTTIQ
jgi:hypothetical protein